jgi:hypothetical protein
MITDLLAGLIIIAGWLLVVGFLELFLKLKEDETIL